MQLIGSRTLPFPRERVWAALLDPAVLSRALPGCESLEPNGEGTFDAKVTIGVGAIRGSYKGKVRLFELDPPQQLRMAVEGGGGPGRMRGEGLVELEEVEGGTKLIYDGEAATFGPIARVGQRLLRSAANKLLGEFFGRLEEELGRSEPRAEPTE